MENGVRLAVINASNARIEYVKSIINDTQVELKLEVLLTRFLSKVKIRNIESDTVIIF